MEDLGQTNSVDAWVEDGVSYIGGGSAPMNELPTCVIKIVSKKLSAEKIAVALREHKPAIIGRISDNAFVLDLRTVFPEQTAFIQSAVASLK